MHIKTTDPSFLIPILLLYLPSLGLSWHSFLHKSVQLCQSAVKGPRSGGDAFNNLRRITASSLPETHYATRQGLIWFFKLNLKCSRDYWDLCATPQRFPIEKFQHNTSIYYRPCYHPNLYLSNYDFHLHIQVHQVFQINLTFTYFHLEQFQPRHCPAHQIMVREFESIKLF